MSNFLQRGKGKNIASIRKKDFFKYYQENARLNKVEKTKYNNFLKDLLEAFSTAIVKEALE